MSGRCHLIANFPKRLNAGRVAVLSTNASDRSALCNVREQRCCAVKLHQLRLLRVCRVQLRSRDGDEPFLASVKAAIDHAARIRAVFDADLRIRSYVEHAVTDRRALRFIRTRDPHQTRRDKLIWKLRSIALPPIDHVALVARGFEREQEPRELHGIGDDAHGRPMYLAPRAALAWLQMRACAVAEGINIVPISSFRSVAYQRGLLARKLKRGDSLAQILSVNAAPGYSEHHSGRAIDIGTPGCAPLDEAFEHTPAFRWLAEHAADFGFRMSYPRDNPLGVIYEPWHWYYAGTSIPG